MASTGSPASARVASTLALRVAIPAAVLAAVIAAAAAFLVSAGGHHAADRELDARAATVKKAWDTAGRPTRGAGLDRLGHLLNARLKVQRGRHPHAPASQGDERDYAFPTRDRTTLRVALSTKTSSDAVAKGLMAGLVVAGAGALLLAALLAGLLGRLAGGPLRRLSNALQKATARATALEQQAATDVLTGLPTGPGFQRALEVEIKRSERELAPMGLVMIDVDGLKRVNDASGKQAGDTLLKLLVTRVGPTLRVTDVFARAGGDEFALILPKTNADEAETVIMRARDALMGAALDGFPLSFAAGYAVFPTDGRTLEDADAGGRGRPEAGAEEARRHAPLRPDRGLDRASGGRAPRHRRGHADG